MRAIGKELKRGKGDDEYEEIQLFSSGLMSSTPQRTEWTLADSGLEPFQVLPNLLVSTHRVHRAATFNTSAEFSDIINEWRKRIRIYRPHVSFSSCWMFELHSAEWCVCRLWHQTAAFTFISFCQCSLNIWYFGGGICRNLKPRAHKQ